MFDTPKNAPAPLHESFESLQIVLIISSLSAAVVFAFGMAFHP